MNCEEAMEIKEEIITKDEVIDIKEETITNSTEGETLGEISAVFIKQENEMGHESFNFEMKHVAHSITSSNHQLTTDLEKMESVSCHGNPKYEISEILQGSEADLSSEEEDSEINSKLTNIGADDSVLSDESDENDEDDEDDDELNMVHQNGGQRRKPVWRKVRGGQGSQTKAPEWLGQHPIGDEDGREIRNPIVYFRRFFTSELLDNITSQSNLYAIQKNPKKPLNLTLNELEQFIGSLMWMSITKLANTRTHWSGHMANLLVAQVFSRDRWETVKSNLHFNDDTYMPNRNEPNFDKLYKIKPIISSLKETFRAIPMASPCLCVGEQIVSFKGRSSMKKYIPSKPHKWGFKLFILSDVHGMVYDFEVHTDQILPVSNRPDFGVSSNIVIQLAECIQDGLNFQLYFDKWFTSLPLLIHLAKRQIYSIGTTRSNRLQGADLIKNKDLQVKGRGAYEEKETTIDDVRIRAVKWHDSRSVILVSTFASAEPLTDCQRYDKKRKEYVTIPKPNIVDTYNSFIGGIDLLDQLIDLYKIQVRSKKYYHEFFFHFIDMTVVNSWLLYRRDCEKYRVPVKDRYNLQEFKISISESLMLESKKGTTRSRGRPSSSSIDKEFEKKKGLGHATKLIPNQSVRTDGYYHFPEVDVRQRCKNPGCTAKPVFKCSKCNVHLCITSNKNCFVQFHSV